MFLLLLSFLSIAFATKRVAVLEFRGVGIAPKVLEQFSDFCRSGIRDGLSPEEFEVITKVSTRLMLEDNGIKLEECDSECEVTLGRQMGVDFIITGNIAKIEDSFVLSLKLHDTQSGSLLATAELIEESQLEMLKKIRKSAQTMAEKNIALSLTELDDSLSTIFRSNVPNVAIWYNGLICTTDSSLTCTGLAPKGSHRIQFQKKDYKTLIKTVTIKKANQEIKVNLKSLFAFVTVTVIPASLELTLNNKPHKHLKNTKLKPGYYEIKASGPCHLNQGIKIHLKANEIYDTSLVIETKRTGIDIEAYDDNNNAIEADVYIGGRFMGATPLQRAIDLCSKSGESTQKIELRYKGNTKTITAEFEKNTIKPLVIRF